jgi:hypothetical protein
LYRANGQYFQLTGFLLFWKQQAGKIAMGGPLFKCQSLGQDSSNTHHEYAFFALMCYENLADQDRIMECNFQTGDRVG